MTEILDGILFGLGATIGVVCGLGLMVVGAAWIVWAADAMVAWRHRRRAAKRRQIAQPQTTEAPS